MWLIRILLIFCASGIQHVESQMPEDGVLQMYPPNYPKWLSWVERVTNQHLGKMTSEIYRDAMVKMKVVKNNGDLYRKQTQFAIGTIASSVYNMFDKMVAIYKDAAQLHKIRIHPRNDTANNPESFKESLVAFGVCQSLYNQIRFERKLFDKLLVEKAKKLRRLRRLREMMVGPAPPSPKGLAPGINNGGMMVDRRFNGDNLFDENDFDSNFEIPILSKQNTSQVKYFKEQREKRRAATSTQPPRPRPQQPSDSASFGRLKNNGKLLGHRLPKISDILSPGFPEPPSSNVQKMISQLNKDNPLLNADLETYLHGDDSVKSSMLGLGGYPAQTRKNRLKVQSPPRPQPSTRTWKMASESFPKIQQLKPDSQAIPFRRMGSDSFPKIQPPPDSNKHAVRPRWKAFGKKNASTTLKSDLHGNQSQSTSDSNNVPKAKSDPSPVKASGDSIQQPIGPNSLRQGSRQRRIDWKMPSNSIHAVQHTNLDADDYEPAHASRDSNVRSQPPNQRLERKPQPTPSQRVPDTQVLGLEGSFGPKRLHNVRQQRRAKSRDKPKWRPKRT